YHVVATFSLEKNPSAGQTTTRKSRWFLSIQLHETLGKLVHRRVVDEKAAKSMAEGCVFHRIENVTVPHQINVATRHKASLRLLSQNVPQRHDNEKFLVLGNGLVHMVLIAKMILCNQPASHWREVQFFQ